MAIRNFDALFDDVTKAFSAPYYHTQYKSPKTKTAEYVQHKNETGYKIEVPAIGASRDDISVKVEDKMLKITVNPTVESSFSKKFESEWLVPDSVDTETVSAKLVNGLLTVTLAYKAQATKKVSVDVVVN